MWWLNFSVPALVGSLYLWRGLSTRQRRLRLWRDALALSKDKMSDVKSSRLWSPRTQIRFRSGPLAVRITPGSGNKVAVVIEGAEGFSILKLRRKLRELRTQEIETGDGKFDDAFLVDGPLRPVSARLDAQLRSQLLRASAGCDPLEIGDGRLKAELSEEELPRVLSVLLDIGRKLAEPVDVERQIVQNARWDQEAGVRLSNLLLLVRERPGAPETREVLCDACSDASPAVRLRAALALGEEGRSVLQQLADSSEDGASRARDIARRALAPAEAGPLSPAPEARPLPPAQAGPLDVKSRLLHNARRDPKPAVRLFNLLALIRDHPGDPDTLEVLRGACLDPISKVRVRAAIELGEEGHGVLLRIAERSSDDAACALAVSHVGSTLPLERVRDILARALRKGARPPLLQTARACLEVFGKSRDPAAFRVLAEVLAHEKGELAAAAAATLGATGSPAAEPPLLLALQREETNLRLAAANALGRIGSAVAVLPLMEAAESADDRELRQAARQAIAEIQSRLEGEGAAPGQISLAQAEAGQLSLAEAEAGQLSLAHAEVPVLPHATDEPEQSAHTAREPAGREPR